MITFDDIPRFSKSSPSRILEKLRKRTQRTVELEPLDLVLIALKAAGGRIPSKIHLQKLLFLAAKHVKGLEDILEFKDYRMGPWSEEVSDILEEARVSLLIHVRDAGIFLTSKGETRAMKAWNELDKEKRDVFKRLAQFVAQMSTDELLIYLYTVYGHSGKSDVVDRLMKKRFDLASSMASKGIISVGMAARIAGVPLTKFLEEMKRRGTKLLVAEEGDIDKAEAL